MQRLGELIERLARHDVEFVLVGGLAAAIHGSTLTTRDVDVCCRFSEANLMKIQSALSGLHPVHRMRPDLPLALTAAQCAGLKNLYLKTDWGILDCLGEILGVGGYDEVFKHSIADRTQPGRRHHPVPSESPAENFRDAPAPRPWLSGPRRRMIHVRSPSDR